MARSLLLKTRNFSTRRTFPPRPAPPPTWPGYVREHLRDAGEATIRDLVKLSPKPIPADGATRTLDAGDGALVALRFPRMPLATQCAFWRSFVARSPLRHNVRSLVLADADGGETLIALLDLGDGADALDAADAVKVLRRLYCASADATYRASVGVLPSPFSASTQEIVYYNADAPCRPRQDAHGNAPARPQARRDTTPRNHAPAVLERASRQKFAPVCDSVAMPPTMPPADGDLDELLAYADALDAWCATQPNANN